MPTIVWENVIVKKSEGGRIAFSAQVQFNREEQGILAPITDLGESLRRQLEQRLETERASWASVQLAEKTTYWESDFRRHSHQVWFLDCEVLSAAEIDWKALRQELDRCVTAIVDELRSAEAPKVEQALEIQKLLRGET